MEAALKRIVAGIATKCRQEQAHIERRMRNGDATRWEIDNLDSLNRRASEAEKELCEANGDTFLKDHVSVIAVKI